jgi:plasmid stabilization system protein ParE
MKRALHRSDYFNADFYHQYYWYLEHANEEVAERFLSAVKHTLQLLQSRPDLGRQRKFAHPALAGLHSFRTGAPFQRLLIFYRFDTKSLSAERLLHGARDLPKRLIEP